MNRVFVSYSHDSADHLARVLEFANTLRRHGVDAELDRYHVRPPKGWPFWCEEQLRPENSRFVLMVCTQAYHERVQGKVPADEGRGVIWEGGIIHEYIYSDKSNERFVPVLLDGATQQCIPVALRGHTHYEIRAFDFEDSGYAKLYRELTNQPEVARPKLGDKVALPTGVPGAGAPPLPPRSVQSNFENAIRAPRSTPLQSNQGTAEDRNHQHIVDTDSKQSSGGSDPSQAMPSLLSLAEATGRRPSAGLLAAAIGCLALVALAAGVAGWRVGSQPLLRSPDRRDAVEALFENAVFQPEDSSYAVHLATVLLHVHGIPSEATQLVPYKDGLAIIGTKSGVYSFSNGELKLIFEHPVDQLRPTDVAVFLRDLEGKWFRISRRDPAAVPAPVSIDDIQREISPEGPVPAR